MSDTLTGIAAPENLVVTPMQSTAILGMTQLGNSMVSLQVQDVSVGTSLTLTGDIFLTCQSLDITSNPA